MGENEQAEQPQGMGEQPVEVLPALPEDAGTPAMLLQMAVQRDLDLDKLERLMELHRQWEAGQARKAFYAAFGKFQALVSPLTKDKAVAFGDTHYRHASLGSISNEIAGALEACDLSFRFEIEDTEDKLAVSCIVSHAAGHSERTRMTAPADTSGKKNVIQSRGSTVTYLQRYSLIAALGLVTADQDDDGRQGRRTGPPQAEEPPSPPDPPQPPGTDTILWLQPREEWWAETDATKTLVAWEKARADAEAAGDDRKVGELDAWKKGKAFWRKVMQASDNPKGSSKLRVYAYTLSNSETHGWGQGSVVTRAEHENEEIWVPVRGKPTKMKVKVLEHVRPYKPDGKETEGRGEQPASGATTPATAEPASGTPPDAVAPPSALTVLRGKLLGLMEALPPSRVEALAPDGLEVGEDPRGAVMKCPHRGLLERFAEQLHAALQEPAAGAEEAEPENGDPF